MVVLGWWAFVMSEVPLYRQLSVVKCAWQAAGRGKFVLTLVKLVLTLVNLLVTLVKLLVTLVQHLVTLVQRAWQAAGRSGVRVVKLVLTLVTI